MNHGPYIHTHVIRVVVQPTPADSTTTMEIPSTFVDSACSKDVMRDPVSTPQGHSFEREDISE